MKFMFWKILRLFPTLIDTSFHFTLQNVNDEIVRTQRDMADESLPVLEQIQSTPLLDKSFTSTHSSPRSSVPETQVVVGNSSDFCPELRMDLDLVRQLIGVESVLATQIVVVNNSKICTVLQKDSNLV